METENLFNFPNFNPSWCQTKIWELKDDKIKNKKIGYEHIKETDFFYKACSKALLLDLDYSVLLNLKKYSIEERIANIWTLMQYGAVGLLLCSMWSKSSIMRCKFIVWISSMETKVINVVCGIIWKHINIFPWWVRIEKYIEIKLLTKLHF